MSQPLTSVHTKLGSSRSNNAREEVQRQEIGEEISEMPTFKIHGIQNCINHVKRLSLLHFNICPCKAQKKHKAS